MKVLYISYNGVLEPLFYSQGLAYLKKISGESRNFTLLTFEKRKMLLDKERIERIQGELKESGIRWHKLVYHKWPPIISTCFDIFCGFSLSAYVIFKERIKLVHARSYVPAAIAYLLKRCFSVDYLFDMRGMMIDEYADAGIIKNGSLIYRFGKIMEKQMLKNSRLVIVLTHRIKEVILGFNFFARMQDNIQVIPCCTDTVLFSCVKNDKKNGFLKNLEGKLLFIYTGSLGTWYNLEGMLDFFKVAKQKHQNSHCVILSPGNQSYIKEMVARKGMIVEDFTLGEADYREIPDFLVRCDVGLIFYKQSFSRLACSPVKLSEYLSCGLPVIISSGVGDTEKIIRENRIGSVIDEYSEHCYRVALDEILEIKKNNYRLKADCRRVAEEYFSLEKGAVLYRKIYDKFMLTG